MSDEFDSSDDDFGVSELHELFGASAFRPSHEERALPVDLLLRTSASFERSLFDFGRDTAWTSDDELEDDGFDDDDE